MGQTTPRSFEARICELIRGYSTLPIVAEALLSACAELAEQLGKLQKRLVSLARQDARARLLMSTPGAVDRLLEMTRFDLARLELGHDKTRIGLAARPFGLAEHAPVAAPAVQRGPGEFAKSAGRLAGRRTLRRRLRQLSLDLLDQLLVTR